MRLWSRVSPFEDISTSPTTIKANKKQILAVVLKWTFTVTLIGLLIFFSLFEIDLNARIYPKGFLATSTTASGDLSSTCRDALTTIQSTHYGIIPSVPVPEDDVCFDYASLIQHTAPSNTTTFHTFWSTQLSKQFTENQLASLRSFAASQSPHANLIVWIFKNDAATLFEKGSLWHTVRSDRIHVRVVEDDTQLAANTPTTESLVKLASLYTYGGVWFDLDVVFVRDVSPLLHQEWLAQASCVERSRFASASTVDSRFAGGIMHFRAQSPYLCEMLAAAAEDSTSGLPALASLGSHLYARVYHRLMRHRITPWAVLPWCFTEPTHCTSSNSLPSLLHNTNHFDKERLSQVFTIRYDQKWYASQGSMFKYLDNQHKQRTNW